MSNLKKYYFLNKFECRKVLNSLYKHLILNLYYYGWKNIENGITTIINPPPRIHYHKKYVLAIKQYKYT